MFIARLATHPHSHCKCALEGRGVALFSLLLSAGPRVWENQWVLSAEPRECGKIDGYAGKSTDERGGKRKRKKVANEASVAIPRHE